MGVKGECAVLFIGGATGLGVWVKGKTAGSACNTRTRAQLESWSDSRSGTDPTGGVRLAARESGEREHAGKKGWAGKNGPVGLGCGEKMGKKR